MSDTFKQEKRHRIVRRDFPSNEQREAVLSRHGWGSTEKIRRRNRKTWTRLLNKIRRRESKEEMMAQFETYTAAHGAPISPAGSDQTAGAVPGL